MNVLVLMCLVICVSHVSGKPKTSCVLHGVVTRYVKKKTLVTSIFKVDYEWGLCKVQTSRNGGDTCPVGRFMEGGIFVVQGNGV